MLWLYIDASDHKIGKTPEKGFCNLSAGWWVVACFGLWIVAFPCYLIQRQNLIEKAKQYPVEYKNKEIKIFLIITFAVLWMFFLFD